MGNYLRVRHAGAVISLVVAAVFTVAAFASNTITSADTTVDLEPHAEFLLDPGLKASLDEVVAA
jgi:hypothetical protein